MDPVTPVHQLFHLCGLVQMRQSAKIARVEEPLYVILPFGTLLCCYYGGRNFFLVQKHWLLI